MSEALQIMERSKLDFTTEKRVPSEAFTQMWNHVEHFAPYKSESSARESRAICKHLEISEIHQVVLSDLMPASAEEAMGLMRPLERIAEDDLQRVLDDLASCSNK